MAWFFLVSGTSDGTDQASKPATSANDGATHIPKMAVKVSGSPDTAREDDVSLPLDSRPIFRPIDPVERQRFEPWIESFIDEFPAGTVRIVAYEIAALDQESIEQIRHEEISEFTFNMVDPYQIEMVIRKVDVWTNRHRLFRDGAR